MGTLPALAERSCRTIRPHSARDLRRGVGLLAFDPFETELLGVVVGMDRLPRFASFAAAITAEAWTFFRSSASWPVAQAGLAARRVRRSGPVTLGLLFAVAATAMAARRRGCRLALHQGLDGGLTEPGELIDALRVLASRRCSAVEDFADHAETSRLLDPAAGRRASRRCGRSQPAALWPPGTGRPNGGERSRRGRRALYAVGEADPDGEEPSRWDRWRRSAVRSGSWRGGRAMRSSLRRDGGSVRRGDLYAGEGAASG